MADINLNIYDSAISTENLTIKLDVLNISVYENITIVENLSDRLDNLVPYINEAIIITENVSILDLGIELSAYDSISVSEYAPVDSEDFADFVRNYPFDEETLYDVLVSSFEKWYEQRRLRSSENKKVFTLNFYPITLTESNLLLDFYNRCYGIYSTFYFTNPLDSVKYKVRFVDGSFKRSRVAYDTYKVQLSLVKVL